MRRRSEAEAASSGGEASNLLASRAWEVADAAHAAYIDEVEVGHRSAGRVRIALGVRDVGEQSQRLEEAGIAVVAPPTPTPFGTTNARFELSDGIQLTLFG